MKHRLIHVCGWCCQLLTVLLIGEASFALPSLEDVAYLGSEVHAYGLKVEGGLLLAKT